MIEPIEGVTKFRLDYRAAPAPAAADIASLNAWRSILWRLRLIGLDAQRYGGVGFGNVSCRYQNHFIVSGTQTGGIPVLSAQHYFCVEHADTARNRVVARGPIAPSSESLTHAMVYALDPAVQYVFHVHSPEIWRRAAALGLPVTAREVAYGTPAMAAEMARLYAAGPLRAQGIVVMLGHEDGVISIGRDADAAGQRLLAVLARSLI